MCDSLNAAWGIDVICLHNRLQVPVLGYVEFIDPDKSFFFFFFNQENINIFLLFFFFFMKMCCGCLLLASD